MVPEIEYCNSAYCCNSVMIHTAICISSVKFCTLHSDCMYPQFQSSEVTFNRFSRDCRNFQLNVVRTLLTHELQVDVAKISTWKLCMNRFFAQNGALYITRGMLMLEMHL